MKHQNDGDKLKLSLQNTTVCAVDCITPTLAILAIERSMKECDFNSALLLTDSRIEHPGIDIRNIPKINSVKEYSEFILKKLDQFIDAEYVLLVQWDGYVIHSKAWDSEFLEYDYLGAPWGWHKDGLNVGNGGFSLRSKKLLKAALDPEFNNISGVNEDELICRVNRPFLEKKYNIKFAPIELASKFSYERAIPGSLTFGFHGLFNMWRHVDDTEILKIAHVLNSDSYASREFIELQIQFFLHQKFNIFSALHSMSASKMTSEWVFSRYLDLLGDRDMLDKMMRIVSLQK